MREKESDLFVRNFDEKFLLVGTRNHEDDSSLCLGGASERKRQRVYEWMRDFQQHIGSLGFEHSTSMCTRLYARERLVFACVFFSSFLFVSFRT